MSESANAIKTQDTSENQQAAKKAYPLKPEGKYRGTILRHSMGLSVNKTPYLELIGRFTETENDSLEFTELETSFSKPIKLWLSKAAMDNSKKTLEYYGFAGNNLVALLPNRPDSFSFEGKAITAVCSHEEYMGRPKENWRIERAAKPADEQDLLTILAETNEDWNQEEAEVAEFAEHVRF